MSRLVTAKVDVTLKLDVVQRVYNDAEDYEGFKQLVNENLANVLSRIEDMDFFVG